MENNITFLSPLRGLRGSVRY